MNGHAYDKSVSAADLIVRAKVQKRKGQHVQLTLRDVLGVYTLAPINTTTLSGSAIGTRDTRFRVSVKQHFDAAADVPEGEFFELDFSAIGDRLIVYANGKQSARSATPTLPARRCGGTCDQGKGVFKSVEVMVLDKPAPKED